MDKERIDGFRSAFAPGETLFWQVPAAARERMAFYSENLPRLEALRDGTPCDAGIVLSAWLRCKEHAAVPFWASLGAVAANTGLERSAHLRKAGCSRYGRYRCCHRHAGFPAFEPAFDLDRLCGLPSKGVKTTG